MEHGEHAWLGIVPKLNRTKTKVDTIKNFGRYRSKIEQDENQGNTIKNFGRYCAKVSSRGRGAKGKVYTTSESRGRASAFWVEQNRKVTRGKKHMACWETE